MPLIRFHADAPTLRKWRECLIAIFGKTGNEPIYRTAISELKKGEYYESSTWDVELSEFDRALIQEELWYAADSGEKPLSNGMPIRWNLCLSYEVIGEKKKRKSLCRS